MNDTSTENYHEAGTDVHVKNPEFQNLEQSQASGGKDINLNLLMDVQMPITIEFGKTTLPIKEVLELQRGSVIELDKRVGESLDIIVNGKKMAEGEVVVIDNQFAVRIISLVEANEQNQKN